MFGSEGLELTQLSSFPQTVGRSFPRIFQRGRHCQVAASVRGPGAREHHLHSRDARMCVPHHCVQLTSRKNSRCSAHSTW